MSIWLSLLVLGLAPGGWGFLTNGTGHYVSPAGSPAGDGTQAHPWDLVTALAGGRGRVQPGDTVWLRGGTYQGAAPRVTVAGRPGAPVVIRQYPGERAILDAAGATSSSDRGDFLVVRGEYVVLWGFELMDSDPDRTTNTRPNLIVNDASHTKYINLILHDGGIGWYTYATRSDVEVTGCIFFNNGWDRAQGGGHAIYAKSNTGPLVLRDNVAFDQFGYGLHIYTEPRSGLLNNIRLEGNVVFNNGTVSQHPEASNILVGGPAPADAIVVRDNMTFYSPGVALVNARFGWRPAAAVQNGSLSLTGNTFVGGRVVLDLHAWRRADVSGNAISAPGAGTPVREDSGSAGMPGGGGRGSGGVAASLVSSEQVINRTEPSARVVVRPNPYEPGRGTIVVYNWGGRDTVSVDPSGVLQMGDSFELRDVQDLFGAPVARGTYSGAAIRVSMAGVDPPLPIGEVHAPPLHRTGPGFGVFILERARK